MRRALSIDTRTTNANVDADRESLAFALESEGKLEEALDLFRQTAEGNTPPIAARSFAKLAEKDPEHADAYYRNAVAAQEKSSGPDSPAVAVLLHQYALALRSRHLDGEAEPVLRRALSIQQGSPKANAQVTVGILNTLGNLLEGREQLDEAEKLERAALALAEQRFGPESPQLAASCTNLADVLWNKKNLREAGSCIAGPCHRYFSLWSGSARNGGRHCQFRDADERCRRIRCKRCAAEAGANHLRKTLGPNSDEAKFVREQLARAGR